MCYVSRKKHERKRLHGAAVQKTWFLDVTCKGHVKPPNGPQGKVNIKLWNILPLKTHSLQGKGPFASAQLSLSRGREPSREGAERRSQSRDACPGSSQKTWSDHWKYNINLNAQYIKRHHRSRIWHMVVFNYLKPWLLAYSRTLRSLFCSGCNTWLKTIKSCHEKLFIPLMITWPCFPRGSGSVMVVLKMPSHGARP